MKIMEYQKYFVQNFKRNILLIIGFLFVTIGFSLVIRGIIFLKSSSLFEIEKKVMEDKLIKGIVGHNDSIYKILKNNSFSPVEISKFEKVMKKVFNVNKCKRGDKYEMLKTADGNFKTFKYYYNPLEFCFVTKEADGEITASKIKIPLNKIIKGVKGEIENSLYESMIKKKVPHMLIFYYVDILKTEIDFSTETHTGDIFELIWENYEKENQLVSTGKILAASYKGKEKSQTVIFFKSPNGQGSYFTPNGKSLRKQFLSSPLHYRRITSYFTHKRFHPILKKYRPHLGIDYAAPVGTPVSSIGDGVVKYVGWKGGFGRYIEIKHPNNIISSYGHLSRYAKGIKKGKKVNQGQVIGYVGSTGLSTGPHLDFRIKRNEQYVNFLKLPSFRTGALDPKYKKLFEQTKNKMFVYLNSLQENKEELLVFEKTTGFKESL